MRPYVCPAGWGETKHLALRRTLLVLCVLIKASLRRKTIRKIAINAVKTFNSEGTRKERKVKGGGA